MKSLSYIFITIIIIYLVSCCGANKKLNTALEYAGANRAELENVLAHYSANESDSLKLKAAVFLIANMPGHYSYAGSEINDYYNEVNPILDLDTTYEYKNQKINEIKDKYPNLGNNIIEDIKIIKADYLIHNIDFAFDLWQDKPWAQDLTFDQFCEYLLPYKCEELQSLDYWRDTLSGKFNVD